MNHIFPSVGAGKQVNCALNMFERFHDDIAQAGLLMIEHKQSAQPVLEHEVHSEYMAVESVTLMHSALLSQFKRFQQVPYIKS